MKKNIWEINEHLINKDNFCQKIEDAFKFIDELSADCDNHIGFLNYEFLTNPSLRTIDELGRTLQLKNYYLDNVRKEISRIFHSGQIDITEECYEHFKDHKKTDSEYWGNYFEDKGQVDAKDFMNEFIEETKDMINKLDEEKNKGGKK